MIYDLDTMQSLKDLRKNKDKVVKYYNDYKSTIPCLECSDCLLWQIFYPVSCTYVLVLESKSDNKKIKSCTDIWKFYIKELNRQLDME